MIKIEDIEKKARAQSMNKWIEIIKKEFDLEVNGETPTQRMRHIIEQLHKISENADSLQGLEAFIQQLVIDWYKVGAKKGILEVLKVLHKEKMLLNPL